jgi:death-on-curing protein
VTEYLDRDDVLMAGSVAVGEVVQVGDHGLLDAAVARPRTTVFGLDAYPDMFAKAAALLQSLARNHALIAGNKRTVWAAAWTFLYINGIALGRFDVGDAEAFVIDVATRGDLDLEYIEQAHAVLCVAVDVVVKPLGGHAV